MAGTQKIKLKCPICKKLVAKSGEDYPFCSDRCRTIDLGKWASGQYVIAAPLQDTDDAEIHILGDNTDEE